MSQHNTTTNNITTIMDWLADNVIYFYNNSKSTIITTTDTLWIAIENVTKVVVDAILDEEGDTQEEEDVVLFEEMTQLVYDAWKLTQNNVLLLYNGLYSKDELNTSTF
jgi:hypothetical protein